MAMGVCTLVTAATAEVTRLNAPHGAPVASVDGYDSSSKPFCATVLPPTRRTAPSRRARAPRARRMAMGVCTLVTAATVEVTRLIAPRGAPVASVGGYDLSSRPFCATAVLPPTPDLGSIHSISPPKTMALLPMCPASPGRPRHMLGAPPTQTRPPRAAALAFASRSREADHPIPTTHRVLGARAVSARLSVLHRRTYSMRRITHKYY